MRLSLKAVASLERGFLVGVDVSDTEMCDPDRDLTGGAGGAVFGRTACVGGKREEADDVLFGRMGMAEGLEDGGLINGGTGLDGDSGSGLDASLITGLLPLDLIIEKFKINVKKRDA